MSTGIEWTDETWNPVTGCTPISTGCANCYARRMAKRLAGRFGYPEAPHEFDVTLHEERLAQPLRWKKPRRVFVVSMGDLFHEDVPFEYAAAVFGIIAHEDARDHTFQVLTKRPDRMAEFFKWLESTAAIEPDASVSGPVSRWANRALKHHRRAPCCYAPIWPNVWLGITAEDEIRFYERYPYLAQIDAVVRFVSMEPLLGPIRMGGATPDWVIVGGETGPSARRMDPAWAVAIQEHCLRNGVPFFYKGAGTSSLARSSPYYRLLDGRKWDGFPEG